MTKVWLDLGGLQNAGLQNTGLQNMVYRTQSKQPQYWLRGYTLVYRTQSKQPQYWLRGYTLVYRTLVYRTWSTEHRDSSPVTYWRVLTAGDEGLVGSWRQASVTCFHCSTQNKCVLTLLFAWITHSIFGNVLT